MPISDYSTTPGSNASINAINIAENCAPANLNNAIRQLMADIATAIGTLTATAAELNTLDGITATTAELNILDGVTATAAEINALDGVTAAGTALMVAADLAAQKTILGLPKSGTGVGQFVALTAGTSTALTLPSGGTWAYFYVTYNTTGDVLGGAASITAGGTTLNAGSPTTAFTGFCWRIT